MSRGDPEHKCYRMALRRPHVVIGSPIIARVGQRRPCVASWSSMNWRAAFAKRRDVLTGFTGPLRRRAAAGGIGVAVRTHNRISLGAEGRRRWRGRPGGELGLPLLSMSAMKYRLGSVDTCPLSPLPLHAWMSAVCEPVEAKPLCDYDGCVSLLTRS